MIDQDALRQTSVALPIYRQLWAMSHHYGMWGVNQYMKRWRFQDMVKCSRCGLINKTAHHVTRGPQPSELRHRDTSITNLEAWLVKRHTHTPIHGNPPGIQTQ
jgi:hypothetical protein